MTLSPQAVCQQINNILNYLVEVGLASDQNYAFVKKLPDNFIEVTFPHYEHLKITLKNINYAEIYESLVAERAYIVKLPDGALLLMRYMFKTNELQRHTLGFYPSPSLEEFQNNYDIYLEENIYAHVVARNIVQFPIRFDYDCRREVCTPVKHPRSHLTLGQYKNCRIPITAPLTPYLFVSFLLRNFYNTEVEEYTEKLPFSSNVFDDSIHQDERRLVHFQLPLQRQ